MYFESKYEGGKGENGNFQSKLIEKYIVCCCNGYPVAGWNTGGAVYNVIGTYTNWPTVWNVVPGLSDPRDVSGSRYWIDFVGDNTYPVAYWAVDSDYVYFRMRVRGNTTPDNMSDSFFVLIDRVGLGQEEVPEYGFAWDNNIPNPNQRDQHGLEMQVLGTLGNAWGGTSMDDIDGSSGQKYANDINGGGRTTDGYVRLTTDVPGGDFGQTMFLDFAVSWWYLTNYTGLAPTQQWRIAIASVGNANDHTRLGLNGDIVGASVDDPVSTGWSEILNVPEPSFGCFGGVFLVLWLWRIRSQKREG